MRNENPQLASLSPVWASPVDQGFQLELHGILADNRSMPLGTVLADDGEKRWFDFYTGSGTIRVPLADLMRALASANSDVHGEPWYESGTGAQP
jgi:hypothetical protein